MPEGQYFHEALEADIFDDAFPISDEHNKKQMMLYTIYIILAMVLLIQILHETSFIVPVEVTIISWLHITMMEMPFSRSL